MPEIITKYPDIVLQILRGSEAECSTGAVQKILTTCPPERFCSLPTGEICVYGLNEIPQMTQISAAELTKVVAPSSIFNFWAILLLLVAFVIGIFFGILICKKANINY